MDIIQSLQCGNWQQTRAIFGVITVLVLIVRNELTCAIMESFAKCLHEATLCNEVLSCLDLTKQGLPN